MGCGGACGDRPKRGCSRPLDSLDRRGMLLRWRWKGQRDRGKTGSEQFPKIELTFDGGVRKNSGACRAWTGGRRARRGSWCRGEAIAGSGRGYGVAELLDRGGAELRRSGARRGCALGFVVAARGMDGMRGSAGRFKGASAGISASAPEFGRPASVSAGIAGSVASARRGGDEAGRWGHGLAAGRTASGLSGRRGRRAGALTRGPRRSASAGDALAG